MSIAMIVATIFVVAYLLFLFGVFIMDEQLELLTMVTYFVCWPVMWIGYIPFIIWANVWFRLTGRNVFGTGDCAHLITIMFASPIGIAILCGTIALVEHLCGSYQIVPVQ